MGTSTYYDEVISQATNVTAVLQRDEGSDTESKILSSVMNQMADDISDNKHDILLLQLQANTILRDIGRLNVNGEQMQKHLDFFRFHRSTLRRLPAEVLAHIFSYHADEKITQSFQPTLLSVVQVCRSWRRVGLGHASLWKSLSIDNSDVYYLEQLVQQLPDQWFTKAKDLPLSFTLNAPAKDVVFPAFSSQLFDPLIPFSHRLSGIHLRLRGYDALSAFFDLPRDTFPSLQTLSLFSRDVHSNDHVSTELFTSVPQLRNVVLDVPPVQISDPSDFVFPWNQLTSLEIPQKLDASDWLVILCQCVRLEAGRFAVGNIHDIPLASLPRHVTLEHLVTLTISFKRAHRDIGTLHDFHFPALRKLCFTTTGFARVGGLLQTFRASSLQILSLVRVDIEVDSLVLFLASCDSLETFMIGFMSPDYGDDQHYQDKVFEAIRKVVGKTLPRPALPNLKSFSASVCAEGRPEDGWPDPNYRLPAAPLADLLRWWSGQLEAVTIYVHAESENASFAVDFLADLRSLIKDCTHDEVHCPSGFDLKTMPLDTGYADGSDLFGDWPAGENFAGF
ncbi:hypothetical protein FPV67DRAFT_874210 [Lyophyllum atratum]|nr:hypothetical protein FPV67DRAFT_874210 [Lyophyllum atratum]